MKKELELASRMQSMLIPNNNSLPKNDKIHISAFYHPHQEVGGDYYDVIKLSNEEIGFCIADVSGKGISAALLMSNFQANLRALFTDKINLEDLVGILNERVLQSANGEKFITLFIAKYDFNSKELNYINAGHNAPLFYQPQSKKFSYLKSGCVGMGMLDEIPIVVKGKITLKETTKILCYTDGLVELAEDVDVAFDTKDIEFHLKNKNSIANNIEDIIVSQHILSGNIAIFDDITMLGIEIF
jgi:sigma-B regulation protein RsbU (phosphoserine phosphatase)